MSYCRHIRCWEKGNLKWESGGRVCKVIKAFPELLTFSRATLPCYREVTMYEQPRKPRRGQAHWRWPGSCPLSAAFQARA